MKVIVSKYSGFCFGVKRAVDLTKKNLKTKKNIYSLGPLIHNKWVVSSLSKNGLKIISNLDKIKTGYCIIPSHGIDQGKVGKRKSICFIDTTCPFVFKAQSLIKKLVNSGYKILILGDKKHPEVKGLVGISKGRAKVLRDQKEAVSFSPKEKRLALVSQTTQSLKNFTTVISRLSEKDFQEFRIFNTICKDAIKRQKEARKIAKQTDLVIVIGGKNSANTKRLAETCKVFTRTHHVESENEIKREWFKNVKKVGVVTGASTPGEFIGRVRKRIREINR